MSTAIEKSLTVSYGSGSRYFTSGGSASFDDTVSSFKYVASVALGQTGTATYNSAAKDILFPNATAHPTQMVISYWDGAVGIGSPSAQFAVGGTRLINQSMSTSKNNRSFTKTDSAVKNATKSTALVWTFKGANLAGGGIGDVTLRLSFTRYDFSASAGANVTSASVSSSTGYDGDTVTYSCTLASGAEFEGWYNGSTKVSSSQTHTHTVNGKDLALEARATMPVTTKTLSATYDGKQVSGFPKSTQSAVALSYGGTSKGSIPISGGTKTFKCGGKVTNSAIGIGSTTLNNSGKYMSTDVVVTVS